jgi:hypothetical protein
MQILTPSDLPVKVNQSSVMSFTNDFFDWSRLDIEDQEVIFKGIIGYILQLNNFDDLKSATGKYLPDARAVTNLRKHCVGTWKLSAALRLSLYSCITDKATDLQAIRIFKLWQLPPGDVALYKTIIAWGYLKPLRKVVANLQQPIPKPQELIDNCELLMDSNNMKDYIKKFVYRKLRAFAENNRLSLADFEQELLEKGALCYYFSVPNLSRQHTIDYVKKAIKHHGHSLISYYTAECRNRLIEWDTASGVTNTLRDITGLTDDDISNNPLQDSLLNLNIMELFLNYHRLRDRANEVQRKALDIMALADNDQFCIWYNYYYKRACDTTYDIFLEHDSPDSYFDTVRVFLGIPSLQFNSWLQHLAKH